MTNNNTPADVAGEVLALEIELAHSATVKDPLAATDTLSRARALLSAYEARGEALNLVERRCLSHAAACREGAPRTASEAERGAYLTFADMFDAVAEEADFRRARSTLGGTQG
jgi:hypothetical protein